VQLDEVLTALQSDTREDLKDVLSGLATALNSKPTSAQDAQAHPSARGETAAKSFNDAYRDIPAAERSTAQVFEAFLGQEPGRDLSRLIDGAARTTGALVRNENSLKDLITNFNRTTAAFASESSNLRSSIRELAPTLESANGALASLNEAFPPTRAFAREIVPGVRETPATIEASFPWIAQTRRLVSREELGGLVASSRGHPRPRKADRPRHPAASRDHADLPLRQGRHPPDGRRGHPRRVRERRGELQGVLLGAGRARRRGPELDGNGPYVRFQTGGGSRQVSLGQRGVGAGQLFGNNVATPLGNRPAYPGKRPPYRPDVPCHTNKLPNLNGPAAAKTGP
jgi:hypothetical protein